MRGSLSSRLLAELNDTTSVVKASLPREAQCYLITHFVFFYVVFCDKVDQLADSGG